MNGEKIVYQTKLHWINADINPHFFPYFMRKADDAGFAGRVSAMRADAVALPFRATPAVSRTPHTPWRYSAYSPSQRIHAPQATRDAPATVVDQRSSLPGMYS